MDVNKLKRMEINMLLRKLGDKLMYEVREDNRT